MSAAGVHSSGGGGSATVDLGGGADVGAVGGGVGGQQRSGAIVGVNSCVFNRPSHHEYQSPKKFELRQSWKALRALNARWALPVYPVFEGASQMRPTKNWSSEKSHKNDRHD